jgi:hypothetical protein
VTQALDRRHSGHEPDVLLGYTGLPSLGHAAYCGVAAYAVALLATDHGVGLRVRGCRRCCSPPRPRRCSGSWRSAPPGTYF